MKLGHSPNGEAFVTGYEPGDMVILHTAEAGEWAQGRAGDWGKVTAVDAAGRLTIRLAGHGLPKDAALALLSDIPARRVRPCDARGAPLALPQRAGASNLWVSPRLGRG